MTDTQNTPVEQATEAVSALRVVDGVTLPAAGTYVLDPTHTRIGFVARHLMVTKVRGSFREFTGSITIGENHTASTAEATLQTASIDTGTPDRDKHLVSGDFLEVEKFPTITFGNARVTGQKGSDFTVVGDLTIKGVTRPVELDVEFLGAGQDPWGGSRLGFEATAEISRKDFGIDFNVPLDGGKVLIGDKVSIHLAVEAVLNQA